MQCRSGAATHELNAKSISSAQPAMLQLLLASSPALQAPARRPALVRLGTHAPAGPVSMVASVEAPAAATGGLGLPKGIPMTGDTLLAALKMRCDNSGASYAIYWANQRGAIKSVAAYETAQLKAELKSRGMTESFDEASMDYVLSATGTGPVATVLATGERVLVKDVGSSSLGRRCIMPALPARTHRTEKRPSKARGHAPVSAAPPHAPPAPRPAPPRRPTCMQGARRQVRHRADRLRAV